MRKSLSWIDRMAIITIVLILKKGKKFLAFLWYGQCFHHLNCLNFEESRNIFYIQLLSYLYRNSETKYIHTYSTIDGRIMLAIAQSSGFKIIRLNYWNDQPVVRI